MIRVRGLEVRQLQDRQEGIYRLAVSQHPKHDRAYSNAALAHKQPNGYMAHPNATRPKLKRNKNKMLTGMI
jgi:hypothetical protein